MITNDEELTLETLCDGAAIERVNLCLQQVWDNIIDLNTDATVVREVQLVIKVKPDEKRGLLDIGFQAKSKLAPLSAVMTKAFISESSAGNGEVRELTTHKQLSFDGMENVVPIKEQNKGDKK